MFITDDAAPAPWTAAFFLLRSGASLSAGNDDADVRRWRPFYESSFASMSLITEKTRALSSMQRRIKSVCAKSSAVEQFAPRTLGTRLTRATRFGKSSKRSRDAPVSFAALLASRSNEDMFGHLELEISSDLAMAAGDFLSADHRL